MARALRPCSVIGCPELSNGGPCAAHRAEREAQRPSRQERGYDAEHERRAAALRREGRPCCLCGQPIDYSLRAPDPMAFSAHHLTRDKRGPLDAAHLVHNLQAGQPSH